MSVTVDVGPDKFMLVQNYPNPFNPSTVTEFVVPQTGFATMKVYKVLGQKVATLFDGNAEADTINTAWFSAVNLPSGLCDFTTGSGQYYGGQDAVVDLGSGVWGMIGGNADNSDQLMFPNAAAIRTDFPAGPMGI